MPESVYIRGEGGRILKHDLPLPAAIQARLDAQVIFLVDAPADDVPVGTVKAILDWVGDDKVRARRALDAETAADKPRASLVAALTELLGA